MNDELLALADELAAWGAPNKGCARVLMKKAAAALRLAAQSSASADDDTADMAAVGRSTMAAIEAVTNPEGPYKDWVPAQDPAEIITDLFEDLRVAREELSMAEQILQLFVSGGALREALEAIACAESMLSAHIEKYHDGDFEPHEEPAERASLRNIQHHLAGSLIGEDGEPLLALAASEATKSDGLCNCSWGCVEADNCRRKAATKSDGGVDGNARSTERDSTDLPVKEKTKDQGEHKGPSAVAGIKPGPSDTRPADVTVEVRAKIDWWLREIRDCNERMWNGSREMYFGQIDKGVDAIRALLDTYKIGAK